MLSFVVEDFLFGMLKKRKLFSNFYSDCDKLGIKKQTNKQTSLSLLDLNQDHQICNYKKEVIEPNFPAVLELKTGWILHACLPIPEIKNKK